MFEYLLLVYSVLCFPVLCCSICLIVCCPKIPEWRERENFDEEEDDFVTFDCPIQNKKVSLFCGGMKKSMKKSKSLIFFIHGLGDHIGLFEHVKSYFESHGVDFVSFDLRGHGKSDGYPCWVDSFDEYVEDFFHSFRQLVPKEQTNISIMGYSLGSLITLYSDISRGIKKELKGYDIKTFIMAGTTFEVLQNSNYFEIFLLELFSYLFPGMYCSGNDSPKKVTKDKDMIKFLKNDKLRSTSYLRFRFGKEIMNACNLVESNLSKISFPIIFLHGLKDKVIKPSGSRKAFNNVSSEMKDMKLYEKALHGLMFHPEDIREKFFSDILEWTKKFDDRKHEESSEESSEEEEESENSESESSDESEEDESDEKEKNEEEIEIT